MVFFVFSFSSVFAQKANWYWIQTGWQIDGIKTNVSVVVDTGSTSVNAFDSNSAVGLFSAYGKTMNIGGSGTPVNVSLVYFRKNNIVVTPFPDSITINMRIQGADTNLLGIVPYFVFGDDSGNGRTANVVGVNNHSVAMYFDNKTYHFVFDFASFQPSTRVGNDYICLGFMLYPKNFQDTAVVSTGADIEVGDMVAYASGAKNPFYSFQMPTNVIKLSSEIPLMYKLYQNYPNPFNPATNIEYDVAKSGDVTLSVYNTLGQEVSTLADGYQSAGRHTVSFDASRLASGTYFYVLTSGSQRIVKKMVLLK